MAKLKSEIAPKGMEFKPTEFVIGGKYATIMTIIAFPKSISPGFLSGMTNINGVKLAIKHIPIDFSVLQKMLNKEIADLKVRYQSEKDQTMQERIRQDYESLEQFIQMLAATQARIFDFQMHLLITADNKEELELRKIQVRSYLDALGMRGVSLMFEQEKALKSILPIFPPQDIEQRIGTPIPSVTIAAMYPFVFDSIKDPGDATLLGVGGGIKRNTERPKRQDAATVETSYDDVERESNFEIVDMNDAYRDYFANHENNGYNEDKNGRLNFSESLDAYRAEAGDRVKDMDNVQLMAEYVGEHTSQMVEAMPFYIVNLPSVINQVDALREAQNAKGGALTAAEINNIIENNDEARTQSINAFRGWLEQAVASGDSEEVTLNGTYWNCYMRNNNGEGQDFVHEDIEGVICQTNENGSKAITFRNGKEEITVKEICTQPVMKEKLTGVPEIPPEDNPQTPEDSDPGNPDPGNPDPGNPDPGNPDPGNPDPGNPDPGNPDPGDPDPGTPTEELDEKNPEDEDIDMPGDHEWVDEDKGPETSRQDIPDSYNPDQGNFVKPGETPGTSQGDVNPAGNVQEGAVDTSTTESADGSGQTIKEVIDNADTSTVTDTGEKVSDQTNGSTVQEQIHSETQVKEQETAVQAQQQAEQERQEVNQQYGGEDGQINTQEENANAFNAGEY